MGINNSRIKELVVAGYVKEASVNISECGYMINGGRALRHQADSVTQFTLR